MMKSIFALVALSLWTIPSFAITKDSKVLLRYVSTTWCGSCRALQASFIENGFLSRESEKSDKSLMMGKMGLKVKEGDTTVEVTAKIEFFEVDIYQGAIKFEGEPDLDIHVPYYPRMLVYVDGVQKYAGFDGYYPSEEETQADSKALLASKPEFETNRALGLQYKIEQTLSTLGKKK